MMCGIVWAITVVFVHHTTRATKSDKSFTIILTCSKLFYVIYVISYIKNDSGLISWYIKIIWFDIGR